VYEANLRNHLLHTSATGRSRRSARPRSPRSSTTCAPIAQAGVDQGIGVPPSPSANSYQPFATDFPSNANVVDASAHGMPRPTSVDYAVSRGDLIEVVRSTPNGTLSDKIEFVRTQPRSIGEPQVVAAGFDWNDAGIGAGLAVGLLLLGWGAAQATRHLGKTQTA
jgi:hypothetical protein